MRNRPPSGNLGLAALDRLEDVEVVENVLDAAVIGQAIEERPDSFFRFHDRPPSVPG